MQLTKISPVLAGQNFFLGGLVKNAAGEWLQQADVETITLQVTDYETGEAVATADVSVADTVFDVLQTDGRLEVHPSGYNVLYETLRTQTPAVSKTYCYIFRFACVNDFAFDLGFLVPTLKTKFTPAS